MFNNLIITIMNATIFEIGKNILKTESNRKSIYKKELFSDCVTDKEKKSLRIKLRRKKDNFIACYLANKKNETKLKELFSAWKQYAEKVYNDIYIIVDNNSAKENISICNEFIEKFKSFEGTNKKTTKRTTTKKPVEKPKEKEIQVEATI